MAGQGLDDIPIKDKARFDQSHGSPGGPAVCQKLPPKDPWDIPLKNHLEVETAVGPSRGAGPDQED
jgi:hypothetical protein